ncbi:hypothetical protein [Fictibacillus sp. S7]|uniref:hypothetical protein n=1 Tax=Fictibacillus sp. S7 TaxID=2212476 RepID=UPI0013E90FEC|nr:hypothetical protein [Fictibacillus sp. S7]
MFTEKYRPKAEVAVQNRQVTGRFKHLLSGRLKTCQAGSSKDKTPVELAVLVAVDHRAYRGKVQGIEASAAVRSAPAVIVRLAVPVAVDHRAYRGRAQGIEASAAARPVPAVIVRLAVPVAVDHQAYRGKAQEAEASAAARPVPAGESHENQVPAGLRPGRGVEETFVGSNAAHNIHSSKNLLICIQNILFFLATLGH